MNSSSSAPTTDYSPRKRSRFDRFWHWQAVGWSIYGVAMFLAALQELPLSQALVNKSANTTIGFGLSLGLAALYSRKLWTKLTEVEAALLALTCCFAAGAMWSVMANLAFWSYLGLNLSSASIGHLFAWSLTHTFVLITWTTIFLGKRYFEEIQAQSSPRAEQSTLSGSSPSLLLRCDGLTIRVPHSEISTIEAARNYCCVVSDTGTHVVRIPLSALERELNPTEFLRVHRSTIVAAARLKSVRTRSSGDAIATLADGREIRVSRGARTRVAQALEKQTENGPSQSTVRPTGITASRNRF